MSDPINHPHRRHSDELLVNVRPNLRVDEFLEKYPTQLPHNNLNRERMIEVLVMWDSWLNGKIEQFNNFGLANLIKCVAHHEK